MEVLSQAKAYNGYEPYLPGPVARRKRSQYQTSHHQQLEQPEPHREIASTISLAPSPLLALQSSLDRFDRHVSVESGDSYSTAPSTSGSSSSPHLPHLTPRSSPSMSYPYSSEEAHGYSYTAPVYGSVIPQYTQSQIDDYLDAYHCYPPDPYQVIPNPDPYGYPVPQQTLPPFSTIEMPSTHAYYEPQPQDPSPTAHLSPPSDGLLRKKSQKDQRRQRSQSRTRFVLSSPPSTIFFHILTYKNRTWTCDYPNCTSTANFTRLADLQRHQSTVHETQLPAHPCPVARCNRVGEKGFTRKDHLREHQRNFHHLDIPKRKPGERSAGTPDLGYKEHDLEIKDVVRTTSPESWM
ncbi:hypothetical protein M011DRAFT_344729 [Sporormia fimetaria CBS 119925]|uniref:C2H2-type domain-containing protein n=1 Tax=Sporormia fimetaria CBS 119925 TaxID=1340428 RepID=A0A6A6VCP2_9PLEO|nr:hypothetical protein M011DRAFT_344729 [Sporormia fimetaria CBS 119925]